MTSNTRKVDNNRLSEYPVHTVRGWTTPSSKTHLPTPGSAAMNSKMSSVAKRTLVQNTGSTDSTRLVEGMEVSSTSGSAVSSQSKASSSESDVGLLMVEGESRLVGGPGVATIDSNEDGRISESPEFTIKNLGGFNSFVTPDAVVVTRGCNGVGDRACELVPPKQKKIPEDGTVVTL